MDLARGKEMEMMARMPRIHVLIAMTIQHSEVGLFRLLAFACVSNHHLIVIYICLVGHSFQSKFAFNYGDQRARRIQQETLFGRMRCIKKHNDMLVHQK